MKRVSSIAGAFAAICMALMVLLLLAEICLRPFGVLVPSADDFTTFLMVAMAYLGAVYAFSESVHVRIDLLTDRLPQQIRRPLEIVSLAGAALLLGWLAFTSGQLTWFAYRFHDMSDTLVPVPLWIPMAFVPLGLGLFGIVALGEMVRLLGGAAMRKASGEREEALELVASAAAEDAGK